MLAGTHSGNGADQPDAATTGRLDDLVLEFVEFSKRYQWRPFEPVVRPQLPDLNTSHWIRNPIDRFIAAEHEARRLTPQPPAAPELLLRRVYLDLIGLTPTADEVREFIAAYQADPHAYEDVVDRLLENSAYGERWGRHWMNVWRYSDWAGYRDALRDSQRHIWHWRDWIIESLNQDKPYDRMLVEMLAADELVTYHTGRKITEGAFPTVGAWVSYGLGSANRNLPEFVVLGNPSADCCGAAWTHGSSYLGPKHAGVRLKVDAKRPLSFVRSANEKLTIEEQREMFGLLGQLNRAAGIQYPDDKELQARIRSYELAFQMQSTVPEVMNFETETQDTQHLYGLNQSATKAFGAKCLAARRLAERGVRFIQLFHGYTGNAGAWDSHIGIKARHSKLAREVDQPIAGLIKDLKQRGLLDETLVVVGSEFGRTPGAEVRKGRSDSSTGRDHHPHGFNVVMAGGGLKRGIVHGATDELGFHAAENRHYVTDLHATVLHQLGLDTRCLEVSGRKRLERDFEDVMHDVIA